MKKTRIFVVLLVTVIFWSVLLYFVSPREIVDTIGVQNGYLITALVALFGGVSSLGGPTYIAVVLTFASAGLSPIGLALASGLGVSIGDTVYFYLGKHGRASLGEGKISEFVHKSTEWVKKRSEWIVALFAYVYCAFTPLPNDILTIALGALKQRYIVVLPAIVLGNITLVFLIATFGGTLGI
jgi:membrane protein YqaA with SNARE-associated domain